MSDTTTADPPVEAPPDRACRWCRRAVSHEVHTALRAVLRGLRHPLHSMDTELPMCPDHVADKISQAAGDAARQSERRGAREPWRFGR